MYCLPKSDSVCLISAAMSLKSLPLSLHPLGGHGFFLSWTFPLFPWKILSLPDMHPPLSDQRSFCWPVFSALLGQVFPIQVKEKVNVNFRDSDSNETM